MFTLCWIVNLIFFTLIRYIFLRKLPDTHWARICVRLAIDICIFLILGPILGTLYVIFILWLLYRAYKLHKKENSL